MPGGLKALILVGGFGTRLRPLTLTCAKPLVPFCNQPILEHQIAALVKVGVTKVVLAVSYKPDDMRGFLEAMSAKYSVEIVISLEDTPMGTGAFLPRARFPWPSAQPLTRTAHPPRHPTSHPLHASRPPGAGARAPGRRLWRALLCL
jgi:hypothetical protein